MLFAIAVGNAMVVKFERSGNVILEILFRDIVKKRNVIDLSTVGSACYLRIEE